VGNRGGFLGQMPRRKKTIGVPLLNFKSRSHEKKKSAGTSYTIFRKARRRKKWLSVLSLLAPEKKEGLGGVAIAYRYGLKSKMVKRNKAQLVTWRRIIVRNAGGNLEKAWGLGLQVWRRALAPLGKLKGGRLTYSKLSPTTARRTTEKMNWTRVPGDILNLMPERASGGKSTGG